MSKALAFWAVVLLIFVGALETLAFASVKLLQYVYPQYFRHEFVENHFDSLTESDLEQFRLGSYDPVLGWDNHPFTSRSSKNISGRIVNATYDRDGARNDGLPKKASLIATYGDSFTACDEVDDNESWQFFLERDLDYEVKNFGVIAYGTDQAVLKFESNIERGKGTPIAMIVVFEENINRILSRFRPFYEPETQFKFGFKPYFVYDRDYLMHEPNPLTLDVASLSEVKELATNLIETDHWARLQLEDQFPYIVQVPSVVRIAWERAVALLSSGYPRWQDDHAVGLMSAIVDRFIAVAEAAGEGPVVVFIPDVRLWRTGRREPGYKKFKLDLRRRRPDLLVIDIAEHEFREDLFNILPFRGHASPYGNQQIARILAKSLRSNGWIRQISIPAPYS